MTRTRLPGSVLTRAAAVLPLAAALGLTGTGVASASSGSAPARSAAHAAVAAHAPASHHASRGPAKTSGAKKTAKKVVAKHPKKKKAAKKVAKPVAHAPATQAAPAPASAAVALTPFEARLVTLVNAARTADGERPLTVVAGATDVARRWSLTLAGDDALSHNPALATDLAAAGSPDWHFLAENVGSADAGDADGLFAAYMASPHHRENILDPRAVDLGMGAVTTPEPEGDTTFNTMDFVDSYDAGYGATRTAPVAAELPLAGLAAALQP